MSRPNRKKPKGIAKYYAGERRDRVRAAKKHRDKIEDSDSLPTWENVAKWMDEEADEYGLPGRRAMFRKVAATIRALGGECEASRNVLWAATDNPNDSSAHLSAIRAPYIELNKRRVDADAVVRLKNMR